MYQIFSKLPAPVCSIDENFQIRSYNSYFEKLFGPRNYLELSLSELLISHEDERNIREQIKNCEASGRSHLLDFELANLNRQAIPLSWAMVYEPASHTTILCAQNSVSNQEMETRYERMFHATSDAVMLLDNVTFTDCNKATLEIFNVDSVETFRKMHPADLSPVFQPDGEESFSKANRMITKAFKEGRNYFEWTHKKVTGEEFPAEVLLCPIEIKGKVHIQASVRDISERVRFQKELDEIRAHQLNASRLASLGEMAGGIAHEINNPIAVIRSQAEYILNSLNRNPQFEKVNIIQGMDRIIATSDRISRIIKGLKTLSRDGGSDPFQLNMLGPIIQDTLSICEERLKEKSIRFESFIEDDLQIYCRSVEISQVILNLISNSIDAVEHLSDPWIKLSAKEVGTNVIITLCDSGDGIPEHIAEKITMPFYTTKDVGKGSGLGLSISKRIIEKHNGEFYLDRTSPNTAFVIKIPRPQ